MSGRDIMPSYPRWHDPNGMNWIVPTRWTRFKSWFRRVVLRRPMKVGFFYARTQVFAKPEEVEDHMRGLTLILKRKDHPKQEAQAGVVNLNVRDFHRCDDAVEVDRLHRALAALAERLSEESKLEVRYWRAPLSLHNPLGEKGEFRILHTRAQLWLALVKITWRRIVGSCKLVKELWRQL